jgi:hypothetical protein
MGLPAVRVSSDPSPDTPPPDTSRSATPPYWKFWTKLVRPEVEKILNLGPGGRSGWEGSDFRARGKPNAHRSAERVRKLRFERASSSRSWQVSWRYCDARAATFRQYGPFSPLNAAGALTGKAERFRSQGTPASANRIRTHNPLVDSGPQLAGGSASPAFGFVSSGAGRESTSVQR